MIPPKYMVRPSDGEVFILVNKDEYSVKRSIEEWPNNLHNKYPYLVLNNHGFIQAKNTSELKELQSRCWHKKRKFHSRDGDFHDMYKCLDCNRLFSVRL